MTYANRVLTTASANRIAYWPMWEACVGDVSNDISGNGYNGAYAAVTLGQTGIGDGRTSASFNGTSSINNVYSAGLAGAFNGAEGTLMIWVKVANAGVWTDGVARRMVIVQVNASNYVQIRRSGTNNVVDILYSAGGTLENISPNLAGSLEWMTLGMTWSASADEMRAYVDGVQTGATRTVLGTWAGLPATTTTVIGAAISTPAGIWSGTLAHCALWNTPLSAAQILALATV